MHKVPVVQVNLVVLQRERGRSGRQVRRRQPRRAPCSRKAPDRDRRSRSRTRSTFSAPISSAAAAIDSSGVRLHVPVARLGDALPIMADVALRPDVPEGRARSPAAAAADEPAAGARRSADDRRARLLARAVRPDAPLRHRDARHRGDDRRDDARGSARLLRVGLPSRQRRAPRRRRHDAGQGDAAARVELRRVESRGRAADDGRAAGGPGAHDAGDLSGRQAGRRAVADPDRMDRRRRARRPTTFRCR